MRNGRRDEAGFTLVEVMVSLMIFALLALAGVAILSFSVRAQQATGTKFDELSALNRTASILSADLAQAVPRQTRDASGTVRPAFIGEAGSTTAPMLTLVRAGWSNIDGDPRPDLQKVAYQVVGGTLQRLAWPRLDGAAPLPPVALLQHVAGARLRYRYRGAWADHWNGAGGVPLPDAVELDVQQGRGATYRQLFLVGTGYVPDPPPAADGGGTSPVGNAT